MAVRPEDRPAEQCDPEDQRDELQRPGQRRPEGVVLREAELRQRQGDEDYVCGPYRGAAGQQQRHPICRHIRPAGSMVFHPRPKGPARSSRQQWDQSEQQHTRGPRPPRGGEPDLGDLPFLIEPSVEPTQQCDGAVRGLPEQRPVGRKQPYGLAVPQPQHPAQDERVEALELILPPALEINEARRTLRQLVEYPLLGLQRVLAIPEQVVESRAQRRRRLPLRRQRPRIVPGVGVDPEQLRAQLEQGLSVFAEELAQRLFIRGSYPAPLAPVTKLLELHLDVARHPVTGAVTLHQVHQPFLVAHVLGGEPLLLGKLGADALQLPAAPEGFLLYLQHPQLERLEQAVDPRGGLRQVFLDDGDAVIEHRFLEIEACRRVLYRPRAGFLRLIGLRRGLGGRRRRRLFHGLRRRRHRRLWSLCRPRLLGSGRRLTQGGRRAEACYGHRHGHRQGRGQESRSHFDFSERPNTSRQGTGGTPERRSSHRIPRSVSYCVYVLATYFTTRPRFMTSRGNVLLLSTCLLVTFATGTASRIFAISLPTVAAGLQTDMVGISWALISFQLATAALSLVFGRVGDVYGRQTVYIWGIVLFTVSSLLCGLSGDILQLIFYRVLQGVGAAMMQARAAPGHGRLHRGVQGTRAGVHDHGASQRLPGRPGRGRLHHPVHPLARRLLLPRPSGSGRHRLALGFRRRQGSTVAERAVNGRPAIDYLGAALLVAVTLALMGILDRQIMETLTPAWRAGAVAAFTALAAGSCGARAGRRAPY